MIACWCVIDWCASWSLQTCWASNYISLQLVFRVEEITCGLIKTEVAGGKKTIMVKFCKQLEGQLVPEWKDVYCNYKELKKDVKRIKQGHLQLNVGSMIDPATAGTPDTALQRSMQEYTSLENNINGHFSHTSSSYNEKQLTGAAVLVVRPSRIINWVLFFFSYN